MTPSKWKLFPYFIVYGFHRSFEKSQKNNQMFQDFVSFFVKFDKKSKIFIKIVFSKIKHFRDNSSRNYGLIEIFSLY